MKNTKMKPSTNKNRKYLSYKEAFARINKAIEQGYFLEAITIEESIICDRMVSYLHYQHGVPFSEKDILSNKTLMYNLVNLWRKKEPEAIIFKSYKDLHSSMDEWRKQRNALIHSMTKSFPGKPTTDVTDFLEAAQKAAVTGKKLARALCEIAKRKSEGKDKNAQ